MDLRPGKGLHAVLNQATLDLLEAALEEISLVYNDELHDAEPAAMLDVLKNVEGWDEEKDNFGRKVFKMMPYKKGALRVTVVLTKQDELRLDLREWYDPAAA